MTTRDLTFYGQTWEQLSKSDRIRSIKWCVDHVFDRHPIYYKWICRWLIINGPKLGIMGWRKVLKEVREQIAAEQIELDMPKHHTSHLGHE